MFEFEDQDLIRFVEAVAYGEMADQRFEEECRRRGLRPNDCMDAPLMNLAAPYARYPSRRDQ